MLRVSWGVHLETIKALGLRLLAFTCFSVGLEPLMKPSHSFLYISSKVWLNALLVFRLALCFASDDPRTSCLFTNTAHLIRYVLTCRHTLLYKDLFSLITHLKPVGGGGVFLGICGGAVPHGCPNPDPISDQKKSFSTPVVRPAGSRNYVIIT